MMLMSKLDYALETVRACPDVAPYVADLLRRMALVSRRGQSSVAGVGNFGLRTSFNALVFEYSDDARCVMFRLSPDEAVAIANAIDALATPATCTTL